MRFLSIIVFSWLVLTTSIHAQDNDLWAKEKLNVSCTKEMAVDPESGLEICKRYLEKYPDDSAVRRLVTSWEKVSPYVTKLKSLHPSESGFNWFVYERDLSVAVPEFADTKSDFKIEISRQSHSLIEAEMLQKAEAVYPDLGGLIEKATRNSNQFASCIAEDDPPLWWAGCSDNVRDDHVVTASAVRYYYDLSIGLRQNPRLVAGFPMLDTDLKYVAAIGYYREYQHRADEFHDVYVAELSLEWGHTCGGLCGRGFKRNKIVVFDNNAHIVALFLNDSGKTSDWVS